MLTRELLELIRRGPQRSPLPIARTKTCCRCWSYFFAAWSLRAWRPACPICVGAPRLTANPAPEISSEQYSRRRPRRPGRAAVFPIKGGWRASRGIPRGLRLAWLAQSRPPGPVVSSWDSIRDFSVGVGLASATWSGVPMAQDASRTEFYIKPPGIVAPACCSATSARVDCWGFCSGPRGRRSWFFNFWLAAVRVDDALATMRRRLSICGVSAAIAASVRTRQYRRKLSYVTSLCSSRRR